MIKVSIIVPIYNVEKYLNRNLNSLMNQTYSDIEVLCINDGSTDNSGDVIDRYVKKDNRFFRFDKENGGLSDARNYGLTKATGDFIMFIDSDDFCEFEMVEKCVSQMIGNNLDMVVFNYNQYFDLENKRELIEIPFDEKKIYSIDNNPELVAYLNNAAWNKMYKKSLFIDNNIEYPFGYRHQDLGTTFRLLTYCDRVGFISTPLYNYLADRPNNISQMIDDKLYHIIDMCKINTEFYKEKGIFEKYKEELEYLCTINLIVALRKAMRLKDREFVFIFIDSVFDFVNFEFGDTKLENYHIDDKSDKIYLSRFKTKLYYLYRQLRRNN